MATASPTAEGASGFGKNYCVLNLDLMTIYLYESLLRPYRARAGKDAPFTKLIEGFGPFAAGSPGVQIASDFTVDEKDVILQKTRWYAGAGNNLEQILKAQNIDTLDHDAEVSKVMLGTLLPKMNLRLVSVDEALHMLSL